MSICKICEKNGYPGIAIAWDNNIKTKEGRYVLLESDRKTPHKHYAATTTNKPIPEPNDYPNPITQDTSAAAKWVKSITSSSSQQQQQDPALEQLVSEFRMLVTGISEYLKQQANRK